MYSQCGKDWKQVKIEKRPDMDDIYPWTIGGELDKWPVEAKGEPVLHKPGKVQEV